MKGLDDYITQTDEEFRHKHDSRFATCDQCGETIYAGQDYYEIDCDIICIDCIDDYIRSCKKTAGL